jgi:hypothetical protein
MMHFDKISKSIAGQEDGDLADAVARSEFDSTTAATRRRSGTTYEALHDHKSRSVSSLFMWKGDSDRRSQVQGCCQTLDLKVNAWAVEGSSPPAARSHTA